METPQRFEAASIEEVLAEVRADLGADAEIIEANKIRSGGIRGFFAKESFEVLATPSTGQGTMPKANPTTGQAFGPGAGPAAQPRTHTPTSLLDLADRVNAAEQANAQGPADAEGDAVSASQRVTDLLADRLGRPANGSADAFQTPSGQTPAGWEPMTAEEMPRISTEGGAFNDVLQRIAADAGPDIADGLAQSRVPHQPAPTPAPAPAVAEPAVQDITTRPYVPEDKGVEDQAPHDQTVDEPAGDRPDLPAVEDRTARLMSWLERGNLPRTTLLTALRGLPTMPELPDTNGIVVAVVGERRQALRLCKQLAKAADADPGDVVLASATYRGRSVPESLRIASATDAHRERMGWRRRQAPTFVAVECSPTLRAADKEWTREVVDNLDAHRVIGIVAASRKTEDIGAWLRLIGGVDGLALDEIEQTSTPWAVLALEVPIAFLDDEPATPERWTDSLMEGMAA